MAKQLLTWCRDQTFIYRMGELHTAIGDLLTVEMNTYLLCEVVEGIEGNYCIQYITEVHLT